MSPHPQSNKCTGLDGQMGGDGSVTSQSDDAPATHLIVIQSCSVEARSCLTLSLSDWICWLSVSLSPFTAQSSRVREFWAISRGDGSTARHINEQPCRTIAQCYLTSLLQGRVVHIWTARNKGASGTRSGEQEMGPCGTPTAECWFYIFPARPRVGPDTQAGSSYHWSCRSDLLTSESIWLLGHSDDCQMTLSPDESLVGIPPTARRNPVSELSAFDQRVSMGRLSSSSDTLGTC